MSSNLRILSWNLQGGVALDTDAVAAIIADAAPDVVALQEVQRRQTDRLRTRLQMPGARWAFKHWPIVTHSEGLAVLTPHRILASRRLVIRRQPWWSWRRRVALVVRLSVGDHELTVANVHLSAHDAADRRLLEAQRVAGEVAGGPPALIVGDLNDAPGGGAPRTLSDAGYHDAWMSVVGDAEQGATNWTSGDRIGRPPTQRIDYVFVPSGSRVVEAHVGAGAPLDVLAVLSDHLPLVVDVAIGAATEQAG